jgi:hypothetical protein
MGNYIERIDLFRQYEGYDYPSTETRMINGNIFTYVPINVKERVMDDGTTLYSWEYLDVKANDYNYKGLVNAIIWRKYNIIDTIAIIMNYMDEPDNEKYVKEFEDFQKYRKFAKDFSKSHFNMV